MIDKKTQARCEARAAIIKAMAHPTRLFMVEELSRGERCVCELAEMVGADLSTVSRHLSMLKQAGVVSDSKRGTQVFYTLRMPCVLKMFACVDPILKTRAREQLDMLA
ncbi:MAG: ArsR/SmtB family transcription factor [Acidobacteriota bacterium]